jgi:hypothetical protein
MSLCPICGSNKVYKDYMPDGSLVDWCPDCQQSLQTMGNNPGQINETPTGAVGDLSARTDGDQETGIPLKANKKIVNESTCSICNEKFTFGEDIYKCPGCDNFSHRKCWEDHDGCNQQSCIGDTKICPFCSREIKKSAIKCRYCDKYLDESIRSQIVTEIPLKNNIIEVQYPNGQIKDIVDLGVLRAAILAGEIKKTFPARSIQKNKDGTKKTSEVKWSTVENFAKINFNIISLYRPVWAYSRTGFFYGAIAGSIIKALDTTVLLFSIRPEAGFAWLLVIGSLFLTRWWSWAPIVAIIISIKLNTGNLFITFLATMLIGTMFGGPLGMIVGTITGHIKAQNLLQAPDAVGEGSRPYLQGILAPALWLAVSLPLYLFWFLPRVMNWVR